MTLRTAQAVDAIGAFLRSDCWAFADTFVAQEDSGASVVSGPLELPQIHVCNSCSTASSAGKALPFLDEPFYSSRSTHYCKSLVVLIIETRGSKFFEVRRR